MIFKQRVIYKFYFSGLFLFGLFLLASCSSQSRREKLSYVERPVEVLYLNAFKKLDIGHWDEAAEYFDEVERQHPYSDWARRSMLMSAFSHYQANEYESAIASAERFISLHPGNRSTVYAYYLIAMCYYEQIIDVGRDQEITEKALAALNQVVNRFPNTDYAKDAQQKIYMTRDHLAGKDMEIGRWYLRRNQFLAAINRFKYVVDHYQNTSQIEEALHRLIEAYLSLGVLEEARRIGIVLGYNYPDGQWYKKTYALLEKYGLNVENEIKREVSLKKAETSDSISKSKIKVENKKDNKESLIQRIKKSIFK